MRKDMTEHREVVNGEVNYTNGDIYNTFDHHLNIKRICNSLDVSGGDRRSTSKAGVTRRDAQNQTNDSTYVRMTIKSIIKEKITELQSFDTRQLQNKLIRMEEENFNLRNRAIVLEERIAFLEKNYKGRDALNELLSPLQEEKDVFFEDGNTERINGSHLFSKLQPDVSIISPPGQNSLPMQSTIDTERQHTTLVSSPGGASAVSPVNLTITRTSMDYEYNDAKTDATRPNEESSVTTELSNPPREVNRDRFREIPSAIMDVSVSARANCKERPPVTTELLTSPRDGKRNTLELPSSTRNSNRAKPPISSHETSRPRSKEIPSARKELPSSTNDSFRTIPKELSISPHDVVKYREPVTKYSSISTLESPVLTGNRPIPSLGPISFYKPNHFERREAKLPNHHEPWNSKVRMYENHLLGEISPNPLNQNSHRQPIETRGHADKDFTRDMDKTRENPTKDSYNLNENHSNSVPYFSAFKSTPQIPRSNSESSIFLSNVARDDINNNYSGNITNSVATPHNQNAFKPNDIMVGEGPRTVREFRHKEASSERKIEKVLNPYVNGYNSVHQSVQSITEPYKHSSSNVMYDSSTASNMEIKRYDTNTKTLNNFSASLSNPLSKPSLKRLPIPPAYSSERTESRSIEYEPLSKVSPKPPPLIPNLNLNPSPNRYPVRHMNIPRDPIVLPNYPTTSKYNVSATNFHAASQTTNNYQISNPNYLNSSPNYPNTYENALPQLIAHITSDKSSIIFTWDKLNDSHMFLENVDVYFLFAFHTLDLNQPPPKDISYWKRISIVSPLPLPIACTLTQSFDGQNYFFAVAAVNRTGGVGQLSNPCALKVAL